VQSIWSLYVLDDINDYGDGYINDGWSLTFDFAEATTGHAGETDLQQGDAVS